MNIKIVRLQSGEDVIAEYEEGEGEGVVYLKNPMNLLFKRLPTGKAVMLMSPWLPLELIESSGTALYSQDILTVMQPKVSLINYYNNSIADLQQEMLESSQEIEDALNDYEQTSFDFSDIEEQVEEPSDEEIMEELEVLRKEVKKQILH